MSRIEPKSVFVKNGYKYILLSWAYISPKRALCLYKQGESDTPYFELQILRYGDASGWRSEGWIYPSNEDWGKYGWTYADFTVAKEHYAHLRTKLLSEVTP
jgi:hypothetical protein